MIRSLLLSLSLLTVNISFAQTNIQVSNSTAEAILFGDFDPADYTPSVIVDDRATIVQGIIDQTSKDTIMQWLIHLENFQSRNTGSDTVSLTEGIGAARRWIHHKFSQFSALQENRLEVGYLDFDENICGMGHHRNVFAVLPGMDTTNHEIVLVQAHMDSRCEDACDTDCYAPGVDDNGSGTVLVMELARVMSQYAFANTIVFTTVTGEEQGLFGGRAWADYLADNQLPLKVCLNNDVVGGTICGTTSSPPSCSPVHSIDSTTVRAFAYSSFHRDTAAYSPHQQIGRYVELQQIEEINPVINTPMDVDLRIREDRVGRGGDHIPFRENGFTAIRFTSAHEHGDGSGTPPDHQHTTSDVLGLDTNLIPDGIIDTFFVDINYLSRNTMLNGINLGLLAMAPPSPNPIFVTHPNRVDISLSGIDTTYSTHRVAIRSLGSGTLYWDSIVDFNNQSEFSIATAQGTSQFISVMNVSEDGVESLPSIEHSFAVGIRENELFQGISMGQNRPNPFKTETIVPIVVAGKTAYQNAELVVHDIQGREITRKNIKLVKGNNEFTLPIASYQNGYYTYTLLLDGVAVQTRTMVFAN